MELKEYKTPEEIIKILSDRGMEFSNPKVALRKLNEINYFILKGYSGLLLVEENKFKKLCDFNELIYLYEFDKELKGLLLEVILDIETKLKTCLSNLISDKYGIKETEYLDKNNFDLTSKYIDSTINDVKVQIKNYGKKNKAVKHYKNKYGFIPFYVLTKCLTIGVTIKLFNNMKQSDQSIVCNNLLSKDYHNVKHKIRAVKSFLSLIASFRNKCAHDEIIFNAKEPACLIVELPEHKLLPLKKSEKGELIQGKSDLFALIICLKYFMSKTEYIRFINKFETIVRRYLRRTKIVNRNDLLDYMNIHKSYQKILTI